MNKLFNILILLVLISTASAAVYVTTNPEAKLFFSRDSPGPDVSPVQTMFLVDGVWSNSVDISKMTVDTLELQMRHKNNQEEAFEGITYIEIECDQGLVDDIDGIKDFVEIRFADPHGNMYQCNNDVRMERISVNEVKITPTNETFVYAGGQVALTNIKLVFIDFAYGDYTLTVYVDSVDANK